MLKVHFLNDTFVGTYEGANEASFVAHIWDTYMLDAFQFDPQVKRKAKKRMFRGRVATSGAIITGWLKN